MRFPRHTFWSLVLSALLLVLNSTASADPITDSVLDVVAQISNMVAGPSAIALTTRNLSSLPEAQFRDLRANLQAELHRQKFQLLDAAQAGPDITVTLSENTSGYLWVIQSRKEGRSQVTMVNVPRGTIAAAAGPAAPSMLIRKTLLFVSDEPILDAALIGDATSSRLLVLTPEKLSLYSLRGSETTLESSQPLALPGPIPRDVRGQLQVFDHGVRAFFPGAQCANTAQGLAGVRCLPSDDPWPFSSDKSLTAFFTPTRNYYTGVLSGEGARGRQVSPFYSAARLTESGGGPWLLAGVDGRVRYFDGSSETMASVYGWGSDIAGITSKCGKGTQVLATRPGDNAAGDGVQAYEVNGRDISAVSSAVDFPGPVTALWPSGDQSTATAVVRNLKTGRYEAYSLAISCR